MQKLREIHGESKVDRQLRFTTIRLGSRPETKVLAEETNALRQRLRETCERYASAREERVAATAEIAYLDGVLDDLVTAVVREVLVLVGGDRKDPRYVLLFPTAPSEALRPVATEAELTFVKNLVGRVRENAQLASLKAGVDAIDAAHGALAEAVARRDALYLPEQQAATERAIALDNARRFYNQLEPRLAVMFPEQPALVESFFADLRRDEGDTEKPAAS